MTSQHLRDRAVSRRAVRTVPAQAVALLLAAVVVTVGIAASTGSSATKLTTINVNIRDTGFGLAKKTAPLGQVRFVVTNLGAKPHGFQISGKRTPVLTKGKKATLNVAFNKAGKYKYVSPVKADTARGFTGLFTISAPATGTSGNVKLGKSLFVANCGTCHVLAAAGTRGSIGPSLDSTSLTAAALVKVITNGKPGTAMPPFQGNLTTEQIQDISAFVFDATH